jgi:hypothetical protein
LHGVESLVTDGILTLVEVEEPGEPVRQYPWMAYVFGMAKRPHELFHQEDGEEEATW